MDTESFKQKLLDKQRDLQDQIARLGDESRSTAELEVKDYGEVAAVDQGNHETLQSATVLTKTLEAVRDALQRIDEGSYGTCIVCGQAIKPARLEAVPWALYCRQHQEEEDRKEAEERNASTQEAASLWRGARGSVSD